MRIVKQLTNNKFLNIKEVSDPENNVKGYQFAERRGTDSIAFICQDKQREGKNFLVNREYTPPTNEFHLRAFGGSLDKNVNMIEIVQAEVKEEVGYDVKQNRIKFMGKMFVSTQMNQYCHLYLVDVTGMKEGEREPENAIEAMAKPTWVDAKEIINGSDWKAISILIKTL